MGTNKGLLRRQNKRMRQAAQLRQQLTPQWTDYGGKNGTVAFGHTGRKDAEGKGMAPRGLACAHPAGNLLHEWELYGCPTMTGREWTIDEIQAAVERGPHQSALADNAIEHFRHEVEEKVAAGQARVILWEDIQHNPPPHLKVSPVAAIPHKSKAFRTILDLSFRLHLTNGGVVPSVNETTTKNGTSGYNRPTGAFPQSYYSCICGNGG